MFDPSPGRVRACVVPLVLAWALASALAPRPAEARALAAGTTTIYGGGSTFIAPLMRAWMAAYMGGGGSGTRVRYQVVGSGLGIQLFTLGIVDFGVSDAFLSDDQIRAAGGDVLHVPLTLGPVAVVYNLPSLRGPLRLDGPTLAAIFLGTVARWDDPAIAALNPDVALPHLPIVVVHRSDGSGTTFIFSDYLDAVSARWRSSVGRGTIVNWPTGEGGRGNDGVASLVKQSAGGIGYVALSYAVSHGLRAALLKNRAGAFVAPSVAGASADAASAGRLPADLRTSIADAPGAASYPISGFSWALIHRRARNQASDLAVLEFLWWCIHDGQRLSDSGPLRYAPLPSGVVRQAEAQLRSVTYGGKPLFSDPQTGRAA